MAWLLPGRLILLLLALFLSQPCNLDLITMNQPITGEKAG
jgi:hypothetical protein